MLTAAYPRYYIKLKQTDASPVEGTYYNKNKSYSVEYHNNLHVPYKTGLCCKQQYYFIPILKYYYGR